ncbi:PREDICTED: cytochrome P450 4C1-like isoform X2 [Polistes dominula]|uniref:Cytochrome P450 4C1-like isoform X2 n=1 Tax=Polistes dominula TaxID=743375 RepID=A0ABM1JBG2_POLDO|nr:PREDICTED: cytochrome P450 4C1-like isoform X2 [Polistes dominula]
MRSIKELTYVTDKLIQFSAIYSSPWRFWMGLKLALVFDDLENIEILLQNSKTYEKSFIYNFMKDTLGDGLLTAPASLWKIHRRILDPKFNSKNISCHMESLNKNSKRLINILETRNGENVDIFHYVHLCTLDMIFDSLLESDLNLQNTPDCKLDKYVKDVMNITMERMSKLWLYPNIIFKNSSLGKRLHENLAYINNIKSKIIRKKKKSIEEEKFTSEGNGLYANKVENTSPFLDALFESFYETGEYSEENIRHEMNTFIFAGSDTAAGTLTFLFLILASFPEVQNKVYKELYDMYGSSNQNDDPITYDDTKNMKYLERVIKETLRLFPPAPIVSRKMQKDTKVNDNIVVPKNTALFFSIYTLHRKDKYWTDPLRFNPDRFLPGNYDPKCFIPFGFGKRGCIGKFFAMAQMKTIVASLLRKFTVEIDNQVSVENVSLKLCITLKTAETILLRFIRR